MPVNVGMGSCNSTPHKFMQPVRFVDKQLENQKTSRVLEAAFGEEWGKSYMREV